MIQRNFPTALVLVVCLEAALSPGVATGTPWEDIPQAELHQGKRINDTNGAVPGEMTAQASGGAAADLNVIAAVKPGKTAKQVQKFIDEDGDGYNDRGPDTVPENVTDSENTEPAKAKNKSKSESGEEKAGGQGLKKGQDNNPGQGIEGALERGIKKGQNSNKNSPGSFSNTNRSNIKNNVKNNGNNRFDRNFEKYDRSSRKKMGEGPGQNK